MCSQLHPGICCTEVTPSVEAANKCLVTAAKELHAGQLAALQAMYNDADSDGCVVEESVFC